MRIGVIDIGSNTTRLLVAEATAAAVAVLLEHRHFVAIPATGGEISAEAIEEIAGLVGAEADVARRNQVEEVVIVATAAVRESSNSDQLAAAIADSGAGRLRVLSEAEEAELSFIGATRTYPGELPSDVGVADIGGGSTELSVGSPESGPRWSGSAPLGSATLTAEAIRSDPPSADELEQAARMARAAITDLQSPHPRAALAVGGGSASLRRFVGANIDGDAIRSALARLAVSDSEEVAAATGLAPERVRLLPAALLMLDALWSEWGLPVQLAYGGQREGAAMRRAAELERERDGARMGAV